MLFCQWDTVWIWFVVRFVIYRFFREMDEFSFPYPPYEIQTRLMKEIVQCIENKQVTKCYGYFKSSVFCEDLKLPIFWQSESDVHFRSESLNLPPEPANRWVFSVQLWRGWRMKKRRRRLSWKPRKSRSGKSRRTMVKIFMSTYSHFTTIAFQKSCNAWK